MQKSNILRKEYTLNEENYQLKIPMELDAKIPANDCVRLIRQYVEACDLTELYKTYQRMPSEKYASPETMLKILLYAYHEGVEIGSRKIEKNCRRDINYMYLLEGKPAPDHAAIARFRSQHFAKCARSFLNEMSQFLLKTQQITTSEVFVDGTKIESVANKYTFVWRKTVTKHQNRLLQKTALLVGDIIDKYEFKPLRKKEVRKKHVKRLIKQLKSIASEDDVKFVNGRGKRKAQIQKDIEDLTAALEKIKEYETKLHTCGNRNSYSKTDPDATFMRMKDDHMKNSQLKPGYNLQHAVNSGFIVSVGIYANPGDVLTLKPFMEQIKQDLGFKFERIVADAGYESEENLTYLKKESIEAYIKPANYEQIGTKKFEKEIGRKENMEYNADEDYYICHNGKRLNNIGQTKRKKKSGYICTETSYRCNDCIGCPYQAQCMPGKNWKKPVGKRVKTLMVSRNFETLRQQEYERINSEEGKLLRMNRSIQVEGSFADIKGDSRFTRFLCRGNANVYAESVLFAMAHNLGWLHTRIQTNRLDLHLYELKTEQKNAA